MSPEAGYVRAGLMGPESFVCGRSMSPDFAYVQERGHTLMAEDELLYAPRRAPPTTTTTTPRTEGSEGTSRMSDMSPALSTSTCDNAEPTATWTHTECRFGVLDRDATLHPDGNIVKPRATGQHNPPFDGFTIRRKGDALTTVHLIMYLEHYPQQYRVIPELGNILGIKEDSRIGDKADRRLVRADEKLRPIFNGENILFQKLPELVNRCLAAPDPIILHYMINPTIPAPEPPMA
ncbi:hypothetical protein B0H11DRAFT_2259901 [Mycena galericulata]|nr:hypothetical protein B0H11DRAFT_2259901 [Mycena galericulata]